MSLIRTAWIAAALSLLSIIATGSPFTNELEESNKVKVSLYYESLCGGCKIFAGFDLCPLLRDPEMKDRITVEFVPYGNAKSVVSNTTGEISITCQHGEIECSLNRIQSCALRTLSYELSTQYICCVESSYNTMAYTDCAQKLGIKFHTLYKCSQSAEGVKYLYDYGVKTDNLRPKHQFVPWVLLNGEYDKQALNDLSVEICERLQDPKPQRCNSVDYLTEVAW